MTVREVLKKGAKILAARQIESSALDVEILLLYALKKSPHAYLQPDSDKTWLYINSDYNVSKAARKKFFGFVRRRAKFEPVAYITGEKEFYGLNFRIDKNVLIPRPETEILVEESLREIFKKLETGKKIIIADIGTGSGAIAILIAKSLKDNGLINRVKIYATDISEKALKAARKNAKTHNCAKNIIFSRGNLLAALPKNVKLDFLLANLPYVGNDYYYYRKWLKNGSRPAEFYEIKHEPKKSLLAKNNGLEYFEKIFPSLSKYLTKEAKIFLESDPHQIPAIKNLAKKYLPKNKIKVLKDLRGLNRIIRIALSTL